MSTNQSQAFAELSQIAGLLMQTMEKHGIPMPSATGSAKPQARLSDFSRVLEVEVKKCIERFKGDIYFINGEAYASTYAVELAMNFADLRLIADHCCRLIMQR